MGVKGLWKLLLPIGRRISLETLEGKILAIDASIWLTQFLKAMRDPQTGQSLPAAHLIGFLRRLCRLHFHGIRPVLVFDGATPEIKRREIQNRRRRREQFAQASSEAGVKRLARRILAQNLQKMKSSKSKKTEKVVKDGFAPGFDPGDQAASLPSAASKSEGMHTNQPNGTVETSLQDDAAILAAIREDIEAAENDQRNQSGDVNDWDDAIVINETQNKQDDEAAKNEAVEYEDFGVHRKRNRFEFQRNIDVDYIASLPSKDRKDAIEEAKRRQRLQSRREFMPAAGSPDRFSSVQLQNFLKSSRLNLGIQKMAKEESKQKNEHGGDLMASDLSTRISLIREEDVGEESADEKIEDDPLFHKSRVKRSKMGKFSRQDSSDNENHVEWDTNPGSKAMVPSARAKRRVIDGDDGDDPVDSESGALDGGVASHIDSSRHGNGVPSTNGFIPHASTGGSSIQDDFGIGGGFLPQTIDGPKEEDANPLNFGTGIRAKIRKEERMSLGDDTPDVHTTRDAALAQVMSDAVIAKALQEEEKQVLDLIGSVAAEKSYSSTFADDTSSDEVEVVQIKKSEDKRDTLTIDSDSSSEGVDWEDGEDSSANEMEPKTDPPAFNSTAQEENRSTGASPGVEVSADPSLKLAETNSRAAQISNGIDLTVRKKEGIGCRWAALSAPNEVESESEGENEWIDGDDDGQGMEEGGVDTSNDFRRKQDASRDSGTSGHEQAFETGHVHSSRYFQKCESRAKMNGEKVDSLDQGAVGEHISRKSTKSPQKVNELDESSGSPPTDEAVAAIARAEATAINLAGWAGRAFRRAIKESEQYGTKAASPENAASRDNTSAESGEKISGEVAADFVFGVKGAQWQDRRQIDEHARLPGSDPFSGKQQLMASDVWSGDQERPSAASLLAQYEAEWTKERNQSERDIDTVTDEMKQEAMLLLRLFGVPYIEAPAEAEAQCAALEQLGLVDGIVTEDSDVFCFGGKRVYKNIFDDRLYAEAYVSEDAEREMSIGRNAMVALAMLLGSDYTEGVKGVGIVNSMEILAAFDVTNDLKGGLQAFRTWLDGFDAIDAGLETAGQETMPQQLFHTKHKSARSRWIGEF